MNRFAMVSLGGAVILAVALVAGPASRPAISSDDAIHGAAAATVLAQAAPGAPRDDAAPGELTPEFLNQCLEVADEVDPKLAARLRDMQRRSPGPAFERAVRNARHLAGLVRLKESDPALYDVKLRELKVDAQVTALAEQVRQARQTGSGSADELEGELRKLVQTQVALSIASRGMYLQRLREHMKTLQDQIVEDASNFGKAVERRMAELVGG